MSSLFLHFTLLNITFCLTCSCILFLVSVCFFTKYCIFFSLFIVLKDYSVQYIPSGWFPRRVLSKIIVTNNSGVNFLALFLWVIMMMFPYAIVNENYWIHSILVYDEHVWTQHISFVPFSQTFSISYTATCRSCRLF